MNEYYLLHTVAPFCLIVAPLMVVATVVAGVLMDWGRPRGR